MLLRSGHNKRASSSTDRSTPNDKRPRRQQSNQSTDQNTNNHLSSHTSSTSHSQSSHESLSLSAGLLTYTFLLPLVVEYLNDGDVVARLLIVNKLIRQRLPKYSFRRMCYEVEEAFKIVQASRDIVFSVRDVGSSSDELEELRRLQEMNTVPFDEVHYCCLDRESLATIPRFVTHLELGENIYCDINTDDLLILKAGLIPDSVVELDIGVIDFYSLIIKPDSIPPSVKSLRLRTTIDKLDALEILIPDTVTDLILSEVDYSRVDDVLCGPIPASLKCLNIPCHRLPFGAGVIPPSITTIKCHNELLSVLEVGAIPNSVKTVNVDWRGGYVVKPDVLPDSVIFLIVDADGSMCSSPGWMPARLTHLVLTMYKTKITAGILPATLTHFLCNGEIESGALPDGLTHVNLLDFTGYLRQGVLPHSVTHLMLELQKPNLTPGLIPPSVTHLQLTCSLEQRMIPGLIPDSVTHLAFESSFKCLLTPGSIPQSVTHLMFSDSESPSKFNQPIPCHTLPDSLTHLCFGDSFNQPVTGDVIPRTVTFLMFGNDFEQPILPGDIPPSVTYLAFDNRFSHKLDSSNLPSSLTHLVIPRGYLKSNDKLWLPSSVTHISYKSKRNNECPEMSWNKWSDDAGFRDTTTIEL